MQYKKIIWFSRHPAMESQKRELERLFGQVEVIQYSKTFASAQELVRVYKELQGEDLVVVAPLSVIDHLCRQGLKPLWAEMEIVKREDAEMEASGRFFRFKEFKRIKKISS